MQIKNYIFSKCIKVKNVNQNEKKVQLEVKMFFNLQKNKPDFHSHEAHKEQHIQQVTGITK